MSLGHAGALEHCLFLNGYAGRCEVARDQVGDGDDMAHRAVAAGPGLGGLDLCIRRLDATIGELGIEGIEDAVPMSFDGIGEVLHRFEAATTGPAVPTRQQRLGLLAGVGQPEDLALAVLDTVSTVGLKVEATQMEVGSGGWPALTGSGLSPVRSQKRISDFLIRSLSSSPCRLWLQQRPNERGSMSG